MTSLIPDLHKAAPSGGEPGAEPRTHLPRLTPDTSATPVVRRRRAVRAIRRDDLLSLLGSAVGALALACLVTTVLTPVHGLLPFALVWYAAFVASYALVVSLDEPGPVVVDRVAAVIVWTLGCLLFTVLGFVVTYAIGRGLSALGHRNFYTQDMTLAGPLQGLEVGGIMHAVVGTLEQISIALVITVPLGLTTAVYLNEFPSRLSRFVRTIVEAMTALPSIVAGLFIYATFILALGQGKSGLAAAFALSVMMLPIIIRASDVVIRLVPANLREASYALGSSRWRTAWHIVLPTARSGLTTAVILGTARGIGETSPVLLTAGFSATLNANPTEGPQVSLPLAIFEFVRSPQPAMIQRGFGTATVLMALVLSLFVIARLLGGKPAGQVSKRRQRKLARQAARAAQATREERARAALAGTTAVLVLVGGGLGLGLAVAPAAPAEAADGYVPISGAGSTWSQNALDQWRRNVNQYGMQVNYQGTGSSDGRNQFRNGTVDFAVSEIPYGLKDGGVYDAPPDRDYAYTPIVAGGTAFMYNLKIGGRRVTNLRLSGDTLADIFTGNITSWDDPRIKEENPALALPPRQIVPVVRSDGSGTTAQFTTWLSQEHTSVWDNYCATTGRPTPCGVTSFFPVSAGGSFVAQAGSLGVAGFVSQEQNEGTITYVEYSYALNTGYPVIKLLNKSGYYVEPKAESVAVGLLKAKINNDKSSPLYLTQILSGVYNNPDKRAYPLSSYSYMIVPTELSGSFNEAKGATLGDFAYYFLCEGQQQAPILGYSPLPLNLVKAGIDQIKRVPGVDVQKIDLTSCNNPTFSADGTNVLAQDAPFPPACDRAGPTQCTDGTGGASDEDTPQSSGGDGTGVTGGEDTGGGDTGGDGTDDGTGGDAPGTTATDGSGTPGVPGSDVPGTTGVQVDPETGLPVTTTSVSTDTGQLVVASSVPTDPSGLPGGQKLLMLLAALVLVLAVVVPPLLSQTVLRRVGPKEGR